MLKASEYFFDTKTTIVIISHSKNILKYCDKIYSIQNKSISLLNEKNAN